MTTKQFKQYTALELEEFFQSFNTLTHQTIEDLLLNYDPVLYNNSMMERSALMMCISKDNHQTLSFLLSHPIICKNIPTFHKEDYILRTCTSSNSNLKCLAVCMDHYQKEENFWTNFDSLFLSYYLTMPQEVIDTLILNYDLQLSENTLRQIKKHTSSHFAYEKSAKVLDLINLKKVIDKEIKLIGDITQNPADQDQEKSKIIQKI